MGLGRTPSRCTSHKQHASGLNSHGRRARSTKLSIVKLAAASTQLVTGLQDCGVECVALTTAGMRQVRKLSHAMFPAALETPFIIQGAK